MRREITVVVNDQEKFFYFSLCLISAKHLNENEDSATRALCSMRWSLVPQYHKGSLSEFKPILNNCRAETIDEKTSFKQPLKKGQRCVILAEGYLQIYFYRFIFYWIFVVDSSNGRRMLRKHLISSIKLNHLSTKNIIQI